MIAPKIVLALFLAGVLLVAGSAPAAALTPQVYCASLASTSCEVLNITGEINFVSAYGGGSVLPITIKYCRNQNYRTVFYETGNPVKTFGYNLAIIDSNGNSVTVAALDTASLCAATYSGTNILP